MTNYYFLRWSEDENPSVARGEIRSDLPPEPLFPNEWVVPRFEIACDPPDYLANDEAVRLCSERMVRVLENNLVAADSVMLLPVDVVTSDGAVHAYRLLRVTGDLDVLSSAETLWATPGFAIKPVVSLGRARDRSLVSFPGAAQRLLVSQRLRDALVAAQLTGLEFSPVRAV